MLLTRIYRRASDSNQLFYVPNLACKPLANFSWEPLFGITFLSKIVMIYSVDRVRRKLLILMQMRLDCNLQQTVASHSLQAAFWK